MSNQVAVVGGGVVGSAIALALARRGADVIMLEAESEPGLAASGTNSGILHTGFDSVPGELETELILRAAKLRDAVLDTLRVPMLRCGATMAPAGEAQSRAIEELARIADRNGVGVSLSANGVLAVPGEAVTDPVRFTLALAAAAERHGAGLRTGFRVSVIEAEESALRLRSEGDEDIECNLVVNCAGLGAGAVARMLGDDSVEVYPRKGEFLVFDPPEPLDRILLPVPTKRTKGVLVFPTLDGKVVAGPTAVDQDDPEDWSVRSEAAGEILGKARAMHPPLADLEPVFAYAGLRPAGRNSNYVIGRSGAETRLVNVAAIRSTGLTASLGIAERVAGLVQETGIELGPEAGLLPGPTPETIDPWWRRTADHWADKKRRDSG